MPDSLTLEVSAAAPDTQHVHVCAARRLHHATQPPLRDPGFEHVQRNDIGTSSPKRQPIHSERKGLSIANSSGLRHQLDRSETHAPTHFGHHGQCREKSLVIPRKHLLVEK